MLSRVALPRLHLQELGYAVVLMHDERPRSQIVKLRLPSYGASTRLSADLCDTEQLSVSYHSHPLAIIEL